MQGHFDLTLGLTDFFDQGVECDPVDIALYNGPMARFPGEIAFKDPFHAYRLADYFGIGSLKAQAISKMGNQMSWLILQMEFDLLNKSAFELDMPRGSDNKDYREYVERQKNLTPSDITHNALCLKLDIYRLMGAAQMTLTHFENVSNCRIRDCLIQGLSYLFPALSSNTDFMQWIHLKKFHKIAPCLMAELAHESFGKQVAPLTPRGMPQKKFRDLNKFMDVTPLKDFRGARPCIQYCGVCHATQESRYLHPLMMFACSHCFEALRPTPGSSQ
jgi:hypothetical protein